MVSDHGRFGNLDTIRLAAAASVIFSHAFLIAEGTEQNEPFVPWIGAIVGIYGVYVFLIISGFLVSRSLCAAPSVSSFLWRRFLRIYPALAVCALVCAVLVAPFYSSLGAADYWTRAHGSLYIVKVLLLRVGAGISTVSFYAEPEVLGRVINGSLWTIVQEIVCYLLVCLLALAGVFNILVAFVGIVFGSIVFSLKLYGGSEFVENFSYALPSFSAGVIMHFFVLRHRLSGIVAFGCIGFLFAAAYAGYLENLFPLPAAYLLVYLAVSDTLSLGEGARFGDLSYGTYLYGWPVEQVVRSLFGEGSGPWLLFATALPLALACGFISWHVVEKPALRLKNRAFVARWAKR